MAKQLLYSMYDSIKEEEIMEKVRRVEAAHGAHQYGESWKVINEISERKKTKEGQVTGTCAEERVMTWFTHFKNLLGSDPVVEDADDDIPAIFANLDIDDGPFTPAEYTKVKTSLKQGKAAGPDAIPPEVLKNCELDDIILGICNLALTRNEKPAQWSLSNIIPVPKSGDLSNPDNYRGISLTCIAAKMYNCMILNRL